MPEPDSTPIEEDGPPGPGLIQLQSTAQPKERPRRWVVIVMLGLAGVLVTTGCIGWLAWGDDVDRMQNFAVIFAPVMTLLGTVVGFYFSQND